MHYVNSKDFVQRLDWIQYKRKMKLFPKVLGGGFKPLTITYYNTKRTHKIKGWVAVVEEGVPLFDVWVGFNSKYFDKIKQAFLIACKACHIEVIK